MFFALLELLTWTLVHCSSPWGGDAHLRLPLVPVGSLKLLPTSLNGRKISDWSALNATARRFIQSPPRCTFFFFKESFLFANVFYGLFPRWIHEMSPIGSGKCSVPHARLPHLCTCNLILANSWNSRNREAQNNFTLRWLQTNLTSATYTGQQGETQSSINSWCDWGGLADRTQKRITLGRAVGGRIARPLRVRVMGELQPPTDRPGRSSSPCPSGCFSQMSLCDSTSSSANFYLDVQQLDGWQWKRQPHKLGHLQRCICTDSRAELAAKDSRMNYESLLGVMCLLPHRFTPHLYIQQNNTAV